MKIAQVTGHPRVVVDTIEGDFCVSGCCIGMTWMQSFERLVVEGYGFLCWERYFCHTCYWIWRKSLLCLFTIAIWSPPSWKSLYTQTTLTSKSHNINERFGKGYSYTRLQCFATVLNSNGCNFSTSNTMHDIVQPNLGSSPRPFPPPTHNKYKVMGQLRQTTFSYN